MSEKETLGMTEQVKETKELSPAEKAKKKKAKYAFAKVVVALCVVLCVVLTVFELGVTYRTIKAIDVDGTKYSVAEYNWLYTNSVYEVYNNLYKTYGEMAAYFFNPQGNLSEQVYDSVTGETWAEYIKTYTDNTFVEMTKLYDEGKSVGYELDEEYLETIETEWDSMEAVAKSYGYTVNDYAEMNYGRGVNEKVFKEMYERYYYAFTYAENFAENEEVSADDIDAYYGENAERFDSVSYKTYFASGTVAEGEDVKAAMEEAKAKAEAVLAGTEEAEFTEANYSVKASVSGTYADWLFDEARVAGDKELFETESGYYVVEFVEANDLHYNTVDVRHILVAPEDTSNETAWQEALEAAEEYEAEWKELGGSEENFAEVAAKYSVDSSAANGGLYENVFKGQMVTEFEDWCFDPARKAGDSEIIKTQFGYHIMYFSGVAEEYYSYVVDNAIRGERLNAHIDEIIEGVEVSELFGNRFVGKHYA
ncbi:MAG: peptidylprolyl isomerase [Oscillospiraceae bacterium]|nr:peptidylprolyl isomerase [Oscillospiraceae bacterium]